MSDQAQLLLTMGGFFTVVIIVVVVLSVASMRRTRDNGARWQQYFAQPWTGTIIELKRERVQRWWAGAEGASTPRDAEPRSLIAVRYRRSDGVEGQFHVARNEATGHDDPGFAHHYDFSVEAGVAPPDAPPSFAEVESSWSVGQRLAKPKGAFFPRRGG